MAANITISFLYSQLRDYNVKKFIYPIRNSTVIACL